MSYRSHVWRNSVGRSGKRSPPGKQGGLGVARVMVGGEVQWILRDGTISGDGQGLVDWRIAWIWYLQVKNCYPYLRAWLMLDLSLTTLSNLGPTTRDKINSLFVWFFNFKLISGDSGNSEGGRWIWHVFYVDWSRNYVKWCSGGRFMVVLGDRTHFLLMTHVFERNYVILLRWPPSICARESI